MVHIEQRADVQQFAEEARGFADAAALDIEGQVRGEEPVMHVQPVVRRPARQFVDVHPLVTLVRQHVHQEAVAGRRAERVDDVDLPLRIPGAQLLRRGVRGIDGAGDTAGQSHVQDILAVLQEVFKIHQVLFRIDLGSPRLRAVHHRLVKLVKGHGLAQIVRQVFSVQLVMETDIMNVTLLEMLFGQIRGRAAAQNIRHMRLLMI